MTLRSGLARAVRLTPAVTVLLASCVTDRDVDAPTSPVKSNGGFTLLADLAVVAQPPRDTTGRWFYGGRLDSRITTLVNSCSGPCFSDSSIVDFELPAPTGFDALSDQFQHLGVLFDSSLVATVPAYNYGSYPPRSGSSVAVADFFANVATIYMTFLQEAIRVRGYVTSRDPISLQCFNNTDSLLVQQDFVGGNTGFLGGPVNHEMAVSAGGIRRCMLTGTSNAFSLDDLTIVWGAPDSVDISVNRPVVVPVLARTFNAITQVWAESRAEYGGGARRDTVTVSLHPRLSPRGPGIPDTVIISAHVVPNSGNHPAAHGTRPKGTWYTMGQNSQGTGRAADSLILVVSDTTTQMARYRTSGVSGDEWLIARVASRSPNLLDSVLVTVRIDNLLTMARDSTGLYAFKDQTGTMHGNFNNYLDASLRDPILSAFTTYLAERDSLQQVRFLQNQTRFTITEGGLPFGGLFDCAYSWRTNLPSEQAGCGHRTHRTGQDMDIRLNEPGVGALFTRAMRVRFQDMCEEARIACELHPDTTNANHIHALVRLAVRRTQ